MQCTQRISYAVKFTGHRQLKSRHMKLHSRPMGGRLTADRYSAWTRKKTSLFSGHYLRNRSTLDISVLGYIGILEHMEHPPEVWHISPGTPCIYIYIFM